jgi:hypothetical protein
LPSTPRKEDKPIRPPSRTADNAGRGIGPPAEENAAPRLAPEWLASMLLDVTAHLMNAVDRAARLREPLERIANATEAGADVAEAEAERRAAALRIRRRRVAISIAAILAAIAIAVPTSWRLGAFSRLDEVTSSETAAGAHRFVLGGVSYEVTRAEFEARLKPIDPEAIRKYWVQIDGRRYPVKQAVGVGLGAERASFSSGQAISILHKLGYPTEDSPQ